MNKLLITTALIATLATNANAQLPQPFLQDNVTNYVLPITNGNIILDSFADNLKKEPIVVGKLKLTYEHLQQVNTACNNVKYVAHFDRPILATEDFIRTIPELMEKGGDCKDIAVCKYKKLRAIGFSANQLNIWTGAYGRDSHMVLAVELDSKYYVLDVMNQTIPEAANYFYKEFFPSYRINENGYSVDR